MRKRSVKASSAPGRKRFRRLVFGLVLAIGLLELSQKDCIPNGRAAVNEASRPGISEFSKHKASPEKGIPEAGHGN